MNRPEGSSVIGSLLVFGITLAITDDYWWSAIGGIVAAVLIGLVAAKYRKVE